MSQINTTNPRQVQTELDNLQMLQSGNPAMAAFNFATRDRPKVKGKDDRSSWHKLSDWIFDGVLPDSQPNYYGTGDDPEQRQALQEKAQKRKNGDKPFIDKKAGDAERLAADLLVGFADEGKIQLGATPADNVADDLLLEMARATIADENASDEDRAGASEIIGDRALRQMMEKQSAESDLASLSDQNGLTKRVVELWADGKGEEEIGAELREGGWDFSKADKKHFERLEQEIEILMDQGEFGRAKGLMFARLNLMKNGGAPDANIMPYDHLLDEYIKADSANMTKSEAFSIAGSDAFLSTIRGIGRLTGLGYTTPHDKDILEKMTAEAYQEHPIASLAGSFTGGFMDPVFFGISMGVAKAPVTALSKARYVDDLVARGTPLALAEQMGARATVETIATNRLTKHYLNRGLSMRAATAAGGLTWNIADAAITNAMAEGIVAGGEGQSPTDIAIRSLKGAGTGVMYGLILDRAFRGIDKVSRVLTRQIPGTTATKIDGAISYAAAQGADGKDLSVQLRNLTNELNSASDRLGRKLTGAEADDVARAMGVDLDDLVTKRAQQVKDLKQRRVDRDMQAKAGADGLTEIEVEAIKRGILKEPSAAPTAAERAKQAAEGDAALEAKYGGDLADHELDQQARDQGIIKDAEPEPKTADERKAKSDQADKELEAMYGDEVAAEEHAREMYRRKSPDELKKLAKTDEVARRVIAERAQASRDFPERVSVEELSKIEAPSADLEDATPEDLAASARFQADNINTIDHRGDDFVKVRVPLDEFHIDRKGIEQETEVGDYRTENPENRPPVAAGPAIDNGELLLVDGNRRATAARLNGETDIVAYVPEWYAKERGFNNLPPHLKEVAGKIGGTKTVDRTPKGFGPESKPEPKTSPKGESDAKKQPKRSPDNKPDPATTVSDNPDGRDSKGPRTDQKPPAPTTEPARGRETGIRTPNRTDPLKARYALVEADDLIPSHDARDGFKPNKYGDLNERPYNDPTEGKVLRQRVNQMSSKLDPEFLLSDTPTAVDGPPIVNPDLVVLGGNARAMAQQAAYKRGKAGDLETATRAGAERFGISADEVARFKQPVLVRVLDQADAGKPGELSRDLNESFTGARTTDADSVSRSAKIDPSSAKKISGILRDKTLGEVFVNPSDSAKLQTALVKSGAYTEADLVSMIDQRGLFTGSARRDIENTLLAVAVPDVRRMAEIAPSIKNALIRAIPAITTLRANGIEGQDFGKTLGNALDIVSELKATGSKSVDDLISQSSLSPQAWRDDANAISIARSLISDNPTTIAKKFNALAGVADDQASGQGRMFDDDKGDDFGSIFGTRSNARQGGGFDRIPGGERTRVEGITGHGVDDIKGVPGDQMNTATHNTEPGSGADPGIVREAPPAWVNMPSKTKQGKRIVGRIKSDPKGLKYGVRSIAENLSNVLDGLLVRQVREQTSKKNPAHYADQPHMIRTRSASEPAWMFHEQGHAISAIVREANPKFLKDFEDELIAMTKMPGSYASAKSAEEGFAEYIRRLITSPASMERWAPSKRLSAAIESANPRIFEAVKDTARAFDAYMQRPLDARWRSYQSDIKKSPPKIQRIAARAMTDYISRGFAPELAMRRVMVEIRKDAASMRKGWEAVERVEGVLKNTAADMMPAYQSLNHIGQMVNVALEGPGKSKPGTPTGLRVHATIGPDIPGTPRLAGQREFVDGAPKPVMFNDKTREILSAAGFKHIPDEPKMHGDVVILAQKSIADAIKPIPLKDWAKFETYAQIKATVARIKTRALEGEPFPYQTRGEGASPMDLIREITKFEKENPQAKKVFSDLQDIMDATLLLDVMSGEMTAVDAAKIRNRFEHYLPLTRQGEGGARSIKAGATTTPSAGIMKSRGSVNPAEPLLIAMSRKINDSVNAYYWNRFAISPIILSQSLQNMPNIPKSAKISAARMGVQLHLDRVKLATASPDEVRIAIHKYITERVMMGDETFNLSPEDLDGFTPDDIGVVDGFDIWRAQKPKAVNVLAPNINGQREYFQVLDDNLYRIFLEGGEQVNSIARISEQAFGSVTQGLKNQITQTFVFTLRNLFRDSMTAVLFGQDPGALVPGFYHAVGAISMLSGRKPGTLVNPELLSRVFRQVTPEDFAKQRSKSMEILAEGLVPRGWRDMNSLNKTLSAPGIAARVLMKPLEIKQIITGQRWLASAMETAPRQGAYIMAKRRGLSDEAAQLAADTVTGNFAERPLSSSAHSIYRTAGFVNPAMQIFGQQARFFTDPVPARSAAKAATRMGSIAMWTGVVWALNRFMSSPEEIAENNERTEEERISHMLVKGLRIPFDYGIPGGIQSYTWNTLDALSGQRGVSGDQIARKMLTEVFPHTSINPLELAPMGLKAGVEAKMGYSLYRDATLEPPFMQQLEPAERYFDNTPDLYRWVGRMVNASPIRAQYFVRNGLGVQIDDMVKLMDRLDEGMKIDELASLPEIGRMFSREPIGWNSRSVRDAATISDEYDKARARLERMYEDPTIDQDAVADLEAIMDKLAPIKQAMLEIQRIYDESKDAAETDPNLSRELKRRMVEVAREGLEEMQATQGVGR